MSKTFNFCQRFYQTHFEVNTDFKNFCENLTLEKFEMYTTYYLDNKLLQEKFNQVYGDIVLNYINSLLNPKEILLKNVWYQSYKNSHHTVHTHGNNKEDFSFVYYIDADENSSSIVFYNVGYPYVNLKHIKIKPEKGMFLLFPSYLPHEVEYNKEGIRKMISGNINIK